MSNLFKMLATERKNAAKFGAKVRELIHAGTEDGKAEVLACAAAVEAAFPVSKEDGKDVNRSERNDYLGSLRMALLRAGRSLPVPQKLSIKKIEGTWTLVQADMEKEQPEANPEASANGDSGDEAPAIGIGSEEEQEALWAAVELVTKNLQNKAVRIALADALKAALAAEGHKG